MKKTKKIKPKYNMFQNTWFMIKVAWDAKEKKVIFLCLLSAVLFVINNLINLYFSPSILGVIESNGTMIELFKTIIFFMLGLFVIGGLQSYVNSNNIFGRVQVRFTILSMINTKEANTSYSNLLEDEFITRASQSRRCCGYDNASTQLIWNTLSAILLNAFGFIAYVSLLKNLNLILLLVILVTTISGFFINRYFNGYRYRHRDEEGKYHGMAWYANTRGPRQTALKDIRIFGLQSWIEEMFQKSLSLVANYEKGVDHSRFWLGICDVLLTFIRNGLAYAYLISLVINGNINIAEFLLYFGVVGEFSNWVNGILYHFNDLRRQSLELCNIRDCLDYKEPYKFEDGLDLKINKDENFELELVNVSYRYPKAETDVLSNINLKIKPKEKIAIVGLNGAGKTTLVKIICGLLDPTEGEVLLNGKDIREYNRRQYYEIFSAVFQDFLILPGTIYQNVSQLVDNMDKEKVEQCIYKSGLKEKIEKLPLKYETLLQKEVYKNAVELSGGETQRLMLARALYKDAPFMILDEPTAALDPIAESDIYNKYNDFTKNKTSLYISHRLASTRFCDRILLINESKICEEGTHEELIKKGGKYFELFAIQSKYYQEGGDANE